MAYNRPIFQPLNQSKSPAPITTSPRLSTLIKQKFPGEYDDWNDDELEKLVIEKYPGEYDDLVPKANEKNIEAAKKGGWSHIPGGDTAWNFGRRIKDTAVGLLNSSDAMKLGAETRKTPEEHAAELEATRKMMYETEPNLYEAVKGSLGVMTPMGALRAPLDIGESAIADIKSGDYGGLAASGAMLAAGGYLGYRGVTGGSKKLASSLPESPYNVPRPPSPYNVPRPPSPYDVPYAQSPWPNEKIPPKPQPYDVPYPPSPYNVPGPPKQLPAIAGLSTDSPSPLFPQGGPSYLRGPRGPAPKLLGPGNPNPPANKFASSLNQPNIDLTNPSTVDIFGQNIDPALAAQGDVRFPPAQPGFNPALSKPGTSMPLGKPIMDIPPPPVVEPPSSMTPNAAPVLAGTKVVKAPKVKAAKPPKLNVKELSEPQLQEIVMQGTDLAPAAMKELGIRTKKAVRAAKAAQVEKLLQETKAKATGVSVPEPIVPPPTPVAIPDPVATLPKVDPVTPTPVAPPVKPVGMSPAEAGALQLKTWDNETLIELIKNNPNYPNVGAAKAELKSRGINPETFAKELPPVSPVPLADVTLASEAVTPPVAPPVAPPVKPVVAAPPKANITKLSKTLDDANANYQKARRAFRGFKSELADETLDPKWVEVNNALNDARKQVIAATKAKAAALAKPKEVVSAPVVEAKPAKPVIPTVEPAKIDLTGKTREELIEIARTADDATSLAVRQELKRLREEASKKAGTNLGSGFGSLQDAPRLLKQEFDDWRVLKNLPENQAAYERFIQETGRASRMYARQGGVTPAEQKLPDVDQSVLEPAPLPKITSTDKVKEVLSNPAHGKSKLQGLPIINYSQFADIKESFNVRQANLYEIPAKGGTGKSGVFLHQMGGDAGTRPYKIIGPKTAEEIAKDADTIRQLREYATTVDKPAIKRVPDVETEKPSLRGMPLIEEAEGFKTGDRVKTKDAHGNPVEGIVQRIIRSQTIPWLDVYIPDERVGYQGFNRRIAPTEALKIDREPKGWIPQELRREGPSRPTEQPLPKVEPIDSGPFSKLTTEELADAAKVADSPEEVAAIRKEVARRRNERGGRGTTMGSGFGSLQDIGPVLKAEFDQWRVLKELPENQEAFDQFLKDTGKAGRLVLKGDKLEEQKWQGKAKNVGLSTASIPDVSIPKSEAPKKGGVEFGTRSSKALRPLDYPDLPTAEKVKVEGPSVSTLKRGPVEKLAWKDTKGQRFGRRLEPEPIEPTPGPDAGRRAEPRPVAKPPVSKERVLAGLGEKTEGLSAREMLAKSGKEAKEQAAKDAIRLADEKAKAAEFIAKRKAKEEKAAARTAKIEERKAKVAEKKAARQKTVDEIIAQKKAASQVDNATFTAAVKSLPKRFRNSSLYRAFYEPAGVGTLTKLRRMGPKGAKLAKVLRDERTESHRLGGQEAVGVRRVKRMLNDGEQTELIKILDGQKPLSSASSDKIKEAYKILRKSTEYLGDEAELAGTMMKDSKGKAVPFKKLAGEYFPHRYSEELFKDPVALKEKLLKHGKDAKGNPLSPNAVDAMIKQITEKGERFSSPQHSRDFNLPGYLENLDALEAHQYELAEAITRTKRFGALDVADENSAISKLIREAEDPVRAKEMVNDYLERKDYDPNRAAQQKWYNRIVKAEVGTKLSQFAITNMGDLAGTNTALGIRNVHKAIADTIAHPHLSADIAASTGAHAILRKELLNDVKSGKFLNKAYGTATTEKSIRTVAALAGRVEVQRLFALAKKNKKYIKTLEDFVDGDVNEVLKQDKLTKQQIDFGGGRGVEISSGIPDKLSLSKAMFADNPLMRLPFLFKRFAFLNVRNMADVVKRQPTLAAKAKKAATILGAYQLAGEVIGDTKAAITGLVSGDVGEEIKNRGEYIGSGNAALDRIMANYLQAALFGIVGDVSESVVRKKLGKVSGTIGGPVLSDADEVAQIVSDMWSGDFKSLGKGIARRVPYIGTGLAKRWAKEEGKIKGLGGMEGVPGLRGLQ